ncbi:hypothetical protein HZ994_11340 [Akkermansiaceae bacterium]|nr:hypothetical protein HZ994_11340 [Akkermansiaceae bacterium]
MNDFPFRTRKRNVWLFTWESSPAERIKALGRQKIVAVLDSRVSNTFVERYFPLLQYSEKSLTIHEKCEGMHYDSTKHPKDPNWKEIRSIEGRYRSRGNPWLEARRVECFFVDVVNIYFEISYWIEPETLNLNYSEEAGAVTPQRLVKLESRRLKNGYDERIFYNENAIPPKKPVTKDTEFSEEDYSCRNPRRLL